MKTDKIVGLIIIGVAIALGVFSPLPTWVAIIVGIAGWWFLGNTYWRYEAWRASGPRGIYWNPSGASYGAKTTLIWLTFGVFISLAHSFCRHTLFIKKYKLLRQRFG